MTFPAQLSNRLETPVPAFWGVRVSLLLLGFAFVYATLSGPDRAVAESPDVDFETLCSEIQSGIAIAKPACVSVAERRGRSFGGHFSAVIVSPEGHLLTAAHCVTPGSDYRVSLEDGRHFAAKGLGASPMLDCGMIKVTDAEDLPYVELGSSAALVPDQPCLSISHPCGFNSSRGAVTRFGHVVGRNRRGHIHNTCLMEPGDSGGGLFDLQGRLIGVHSYIARSLSENFDIPIDWFQRYWDPLEEPKEFSPPFGLARFGILVKPGPADENGAEVAEVREGSAASDAGIRAGDRITSLNRRPIGAGVDINRSWRRVMPRGGGDLTVTINRDGDEQSATLRRPTSRSFAVSGVPNEDYKVFEDLPSELALLENDVDDCAVRIASTKGTRTVASLGTAIGSDGRILSKSSLVGESPNVTNSHGDVLPAEILWRDDANDLILLDVDDTLDRWVDLSQPSSDAEGLLLLTPRPGAQAGLVGVIGSKPFRSVREREIGFLGVTLEMASDKVALKDIHGEPAQKAGLKAGDIVLKLNERAVREISELVNTVRAASPGEEVQMTIQRQGNTREVEVTLGSRPLNSGMHVADQFEGGSSVRRSGFETVFCHDSPIEPEQCGGPVFDTRGRFAGVNIARYSRTHAYAIPTEELREIVNRRSGD